jgi:Negative regulator of sigma F
VESPDRRDRLLAAIGAMPAPTRRELLRRQAWLIVVGVVGALTLFWVEGGLRATGRPPSLVAWTSLGTSAFVGVGMWFLFTRTRTGHRRGWAVLGLATLAPIVAFVSWRYGLGRLYDLASPWPTRPGLRCFGMSVATGGILLFALLTAWRHVDPMSPRATGAAFGAGAGLGSALLIDLWCPVAYLPHLLVGHVLPIAVLALAGAAVGEKLLGVVGRR